VTFQPAVVAAVHLAPIGTKNGCSDARLDAPPAKIVISEPLPSLIDTAPADVVAGTISTPAR
jgi:hypothetical protein